MHNQQADASYKGLPTFEYAKTHKNDLEVCQGCCAGELEAFKRTGQAPAPYFFERVAVLLSKERRWSEVVEHCETYLKSLEDYRKAAESQSSPSAKVWLSPKVEALKVRLANARSKALPQQQG